MKKISLKMITLVVVSIFIYLIRTQIFESNIDANAVIRIIGIVVGVLAVLYLIVEERMNLAFFSGRSQSAGSNANASVVAGGAIALISQSWPQILLGCIVGIGIIALISLVIKKKIV